MGSEQLSVVGISVSKTESGLADVRPVLGRIDLGSIKASDLGLLDKSGRLTDHARQTLRARTLNAKG